MEASASSAVANVSEHRVLVILYLLSTGETDPLLSPFSRLVSNTRAPNRLIVSETGTCCAIVRGGSTGWSAESPRFRTIQVCPKDLPAILLQDQGAVERGPEAVP